MTIPAALRLDPEDDFPVQQARPRVGSPIVIGAAAALLLGSVGGGWLLGHMTASSAPANPQVTNVAAAPVIEASASAVLTAPQTPEGAIQAGTSFLALYFSLLDQPPSAQSLIGLQGVLADTGDTTVKGLTSEVTNAQGRLGGTTKGYVSFSPVSYSVDYADNQATVHVWSVYVIAGGTTQLHASNWFTNDVTVVRQGNEWRVKTWKIMPGPTPQNVAASSDETKLADALAGKSEYRFIGAAAGPTSQPAPTAISTTTSSTTTPTPTTTAAP